MNLDRGIRARQLRPSRIGGLSASSAQMNYTNKNLTIESDINKIKINFFAGLVFPHFLTLRVTLMGVPIEDMSCQLNVGVGDKNYQSSLYYDTKIVSEEETAMAQFGRFEAVDLYLKGQNQWNDKPFQGNTYNEFDILLPEKGRLYRKKFRSQKGVLRQTKKLNTQKIWEIHLPEERPLISKVPLFGYGGFFRKGVNIELIMPIFSTLSFANNVSRPNLYSLDYLQKNSINPPQGGMREGDHWFFHDNLSEDEQTNLATTLKSGAVTVILQHKKTKIKKIYKSYSFDQSNIRNGEIDIIFMP